MSELLGLAMNFLVVQGDLTPFVLDRGMDHQKTCAVLPIDHPLEVSWFRQQRGCLPGPSLKVMSVSMSDPDSIYPCVFLKADTV